ncbi:MAG: uncharacterized membrane protein (UPF0127 family) [Gammaproteobacteria bacterium]|jgi:uncharacterized membrane protein (UPF0127 family)
MIHGYLTDINDNCLFEKVLRTTRFLERLCGLLFSPRLKNNEALLIEPCSSVHTVGMRYAIDVVFIDKDWHVIKTTKSLKPWRLAASSKAYRVLELASEGLAQIELPSGQKLKWHSHVE